MATPAASRTASLLSLALVVATLSAQGRAETLELSISGTKLVQDSTGLPSRLEGIVFFRGARAGQLAGTYHETLEPRVDSERGFTGTSGRSTFRLFRRDAEGLAIDEITTANESRIVGEILATRELLVESSGAVVESSGGFADASGFMRSAAAVRLGEPFRLEVEVTLTLARTAAAGAAAGVEGGCPRPCCNARGAGEALVVELREGEPAALRYSPGFKAAIVRRAVGEEKSAEALEAETGVSHALLGRWIGEAKALGSLASKIQSLLGGQATAPKARSFEEKLGVVLRAATYPEDERGEFLRRSGVTETELGAWRAAILDAVDAGKDGAPRHDESSGAESGEPDRAIPRALPADDIESLRSLRERLEGLGDGE